MTNTHIPEDKLEPNVKEFGDFALTWRDFPYDRVVTYPYASLYSKGVYMGFCCDCDRTHGGPEQWYKKQLRKMKANLPKLEQELARIQKLVDERQTL